MKVKKIISAIAVFTFCFYNIAFASDIAKTSQSTSSVCSDWARESIEKAIALGLVPENLQSNYTQNITRAEFCRLAVQTYMAKTGYTLQRDLQTPFTDVDDDYVTTAVILNIVSGVGDNKFNPNSNITRQEAAVMLNNLAEEAAVENNETKDEKYIDESYFATWAKSAIYSISSIKSGETTVMSGTEKNKFSPWMNYTREQAIATMYRLYGCDSTPVIIPQDNNFYFSKDNQSICKIDADNNGYAELCKFGESDLIKIKGVSGNEIYYTVNFGDTSRYEIALYKINTDGTNNTELIPAAYNIYIGHKYIYYVPFDKRTTVVRTNLDGTNRVVADFSNLVSESAMCEIRSDKNDIFYTQIYNVERYPEVTYMYSYDFSTGTATKLSPDEKTEWPENEVLTDGKYKYYVYPKVLNNYTGMTDFELHRCNIDGTNDVILDHICDDGCGKMTLYKNKIYVPFIDEYTLCIGIYDSDGNREEYKIPPDENGKQRRSGYFCGVRNDKIIYNFFSDSIVRSAGIDDMTKVEHSEDVDDTE